LLLRTLSESLPCVAVPSAAAAGRRVVVHEGDRARPGAPAACSPAFVAVPSIVRESTNCGLMRCG